MGGSRTPGLYLVNSTGEMVPLHTEDGNGDRKLFHEYLEENGIDDMRKPCEEYHPLPCGLDEDCQVPVEYYGLEKSNHEVFLEFLKDRASVDEGNTTKSG